jgi:hypothetical protein
MLQSKLLLVLHALAIVDVLDPHQSKSLVVAGAILRACRSQPWLLLLVI